MILHISVYIRYNIHISNKLVKLFLLWKDIALDYNYILLVFSGINKDVKSSVD